MCIRDRAKGAHSLAALRKLSWQEIFAPVQGGGRFGIVMDGYVLPISAAEAFAQGKQNDVPTITGCNREDLGGGATHPTVTAEQFERQAQQRYGDLASEFLKLYPAATDDRAKVSSNESAWDSERAEQYFWAVVRGKTAKTQAYTYFWEHTLPGPDADKYGAFHTSEVPYVMNTLYTSGRPFTDAVSYTHLSRCSPLSREKSCGAGHGAELGAARCPEAAWCSPRLTGRNGRAF